MIRLLTQKKLMMVADTKGTNLPSPVMRIREISAGVPMKLPIPPAAMPMPAFMKKFGDLLSLEEE